MALVFIKEVRPGVRLGLWRMDEAPEQLLLCYPHLRGLELTARYVGRQKEILCTRALLAEMTGDERLHIDHAESGQPLVEGWHVSISHTKGYAALMLSREMAVGVDIEYRSARIVKIASHFIRPDEMASVAAPTAPETGSQAATSSSEEEVLRMLMLWCAKETLYKLHCADKLGYFEMRQTTRPPRFPAEGGDAEADVLITLENMKRGEPVAVHACLTPHYCLTWATATTPSRKDGQPRTTACS